MRVFDRHMNNYCGSQSFRKKNKWLQEQLKGYREILWIDYLEKHLENRRKEKKRQISALQLADGCKGGPDQKKLREQIALLSMQLAREEQCYSNLKEEMFKYKPNSQPNKQDSLLSSHYSEQDHKHRKKREQMPRKLEKMRVEAEKNGRKDKREGRRQVEEAVSSSSKR